MNDKIVWYQFYRIKIRQHEQKSREVNVFVTFHITKIYVIFFSWRTLENIYPGMLIMWLMTQLQADSADFTTS